MIIEYVGRADRQVGMGTVHVVHAWWHSVSDDMGAVKRDAVRAVREAVGEVAAYRGEVSHVDMSTYSSPHLNAVIRVRVLTREESDHRAELRARRYTVCDECGECEPCYVVRRYVRGPARSSEAHACIEPALCFACYDRMRSGQQPWTMLHWLNRNGRIQHV